MGLLISLISNIFGYTKRRVGWKRRLSIVKITKGVAFVKIRWDDIGVVAISDETFLFERNLTTEDWSEFHVTKHSAVSWKKQFWETLPRIRKQNFTKVRQFLWKVSYVRFWSFGRCSAPLFYEQVWEPNLAPWNLQIEKKEEILCLKSDFFHPLPIHIWVWKWSISWNKVS